MRQLLITVLLAGALAPAAASAEDASFARALRSQAERGDRDSSSDARSSNNRSQRADRPARTERADRPAHIERSQRSSDSGSHLRTDHHSDAPASGSHREYHRDVRQDHRDFHADDPSRREHREYHRDVEREHRADHRSWNRDSRRGSHGDYHRDRRQEHGDLHASDPSRREHRDWHRGAERQHDRRHVAWNTSWRRDSRYNWYDYRSRYGSLYRLGRYYDPYGWGYRRWSIGFTLWPSYYGSSFWLNDPWQYRLPPADGPYRWIRYFDDALLVNIYTGEVVDVIHNFFW